MITHLLILVDTSKPNQFPVFKIRYWRIFFNILNVDR